MCFCKGREREGERYREVEKEEEKEEERGCSDIVLMMRRCVEATKIEEIKIRSSSEGINTNNDTLTHHTNHIIN